MVNYPPVGQVTHCEAGGSFFALGVEHPYPNLLICLGSDFTFVEHLALDFIDFFGGLVGDPGIEPGVRLREGVTVPCHTLRPVAHYIFVLRHQICRLVTVMLGGRQQENLLRCELGQRIAYAYFCEVIRP